MSSEFSDKSKVLVLDFDHTVYDTDAFLYYEIRTRMLERFHLPMREWEEAYEVAVRGGYTLESHGRELVRVLGQGIFTLDEIKEFELEINFKKYLYGDVPDFINKAKDEGFYILLLSFGSPDWQDKKVKGVGIDKLVDQIEYTRTEGSKAEYLKKLDLGDKQIIFVENNGKDLDQVLEALPQTRTYLINRIPKEVRDKDEDAFMQVRYAESRKMAEKVTKHEHKHCHSLTEVEL